MLGLMWFRAKTLRVLRDDCRYDPAVPGKQSEPFNLATKLARDLKGNEYDAAVMFLGSCIMLLESLSGPVADETVVFTEQHFFTIQRLRRFCALERTCLEVESEVQKALTKLSMRAARDRRTRTQ